MPPLPEVKVAIGRNHTIQMATEPLQLKAKLFDCDFTGYQFIETQLPKPFNKFYLRAKGARRRELDCSVLRLADEIDCNEWTENTEFVWDDASTLQANFDTPARVRAAWQDMFSYRAESENVPGLRPPQLGSLHAIIAHFSVGEKHDPATVVLPTGTGKTETMLATLLCERPETLLVLVPSDALRGQIAEKFERLGLLRKLGCIPEHVPNPRVIRLKAGLRSAEEAKQVMSTSNVIVALPNTIEASVPEAASILCEGCTTLFIDEAHHLGAATWQKIRDRFLAKKVVQFTATPFRNDRKPLGGKVIFNYKLSDAQRDGYYKKIRLDAIEEYGEDALRDRAIAMRAIEILRADRDEHNLDHLLMARVKNTKKADELLTLYQELAPDLNPVAVYSGPGRSKLNEAAFAKLRDNSDDGSRIVVCVDMLGEGFDLPQLKVAAVHDNHKSLAVTLQFIGRFTRQADSVGDAAVVLNLADANAEKRLEELYSEGADWDQLVSRLSEDRIAEELELQDVIESLKSGGDLHDKISLWNLHPSLSTQVFRTECEDWTPSNFRSAFPKKADVWHSLSSEKHVLVVVAGQETPVKWGGYEDLVEITYGLLIAYWDSENNVLFVHASDYDAMRASLVARLITGNETELLNGPRVFNVLNNVELPLAKSLGSSRIGAISFTSYFGPNVTEGLASIEKSESELNNIACLGYEEGEKVLWGAAQKKAKIWQRKGGSINDWLHWCSKVHSKLQDDQDQDSNITRDFLRPQKLTTAYTEPAISILWGEYLQSSFSDHLAIIFGQDEVPLFLCDIELLETNEGDLRFAIFTDTKRSIYSFQISPDEPRGYRYDHLDGPSVSFRISKNTVRDFDEQTYIDPPIVRYADGTYSYNNFHVPFDLGAGNFAADLIEEWDWDGIPLNRESMGKARAVDTIQYRTFERIADEFPLIFNDDGSGEAGDLVALKDISETEIGLTLIHCKNAVGGVVSSDIRNLYTVCGQAQKSISVKHGGVKKLSLDLRRRHQIWANDGSSRLLKGDLKTLAYFVEKARKAHVKFEVVIVQPGLSRSSLTPDTAKLLGTTELFLKRTTEAEFRLVGSSSPGE